MSYNDKKAEALDERAEMVSLSDKHNVADMESGDYSGATKKTDPAEIALVRKLDIRIMVRPSLNMEIKTLIQR